MGPIGAAQHCLGGNLVMALLYALATLEIKELLFQWVVKGSCLIDLMYFSPFYNCYLKIIRSQEENYLHFSSEKFRRKTKIRILCTQNLSFLTSQNDVISIFIQSTSISSPEEAPVYKRLLSYLQGNHYKSEFAGVFPIPCFIVVKIPGC